MINVIIYNYIIYIYYL